MYARLGFAVAVFSRPDIVLVDEVLAVGDASFSRRALEALRQIIADGRTVLFISHDMWNVRRLCDRILWIEEGRVRAYGPAGEIAERYMNEVNLAALANQAVSLQSHRAGTGELRYTAVGIVGESGVPATTLTRVKRSSCPRRIAPSGRSNGRCFRWRSSTSTRGSSSRQRRRREPIHRNPFRTGAPSSAASRICPCVPASMR